MMIRAVALALVVFASMALAQQAPPPPPDSATAPPPPPPGLTPEHVEISKMIRDGQYAAAQSKLDALLANDAKNPQARFLKGVVQNDEGNADAALATFQSLTEDYPELPEPHNNLAVIWAQKGQYEKAKSSLELALRSNPDYAIAHENLGDVYTRLAGAEYDRAMSLDKGNKSAQAKLKLVRDLYAMEASVTPTPAPAPEPAAAAKKKK